MSPPKLPISCAGIPARSAAFINASLSLQAKIYLPWSSPKNHPVSPPKRETPNPAEIDISVAAIAKPPSDTSCAAVIMFDLWLARTKSPAIFSALRSTKGASPSSRSNNSFIIAD